MRFSALLAGFCLTLMLLPSCGSGDGSSPDGSQGDEPAVLTFWHFWSEPAQRRALDSVIAGFEAEYNCRVEKTELSWNDGKAKLLAAFNSGQAPDALELGSDWVAQFAGSGVLADLSGERADLNSFLPFTHRVAKNGAEIAAWPWVVDSRVIYYNRDLLTQAGLDADNPPTDFAGLVAAAEKINEIDGVYGFGVNGPDRNRLYKKILPLFWSSGGDIFGPGGVPNLNSASNVKGLELYVSTAQSGLVETQRQLDDAFIRGTIGIWMSGSWLLDRIAAENPSLDYGVMTMPAVDGNPGVSFAGGEYLAVNAKSDNMDLARKFVHWMCDGKNALEWCKKVSSAGFPADTSYFAAPYFRSRPHRETFAAQLRSARMTPVHPRWLDMQDVIEEATVEALYGNKTAQESLDDAQTAVLDLLGMGTEN